ncbi:MAG: dTMP kinase, partial [Georgfuchsia sp.]
TLQPDMTFLFDIDVITATKRLQGTGQVADRFEQEKTDFFERVRQAYLDRAREFPCRFHVFDASLSINDIHIMLEEVIISDC